MRADLTALSAFLGSKPFLLGDRVARVDCLAFGMLAQILWSPFPNPYVTLIDSEFPQLRAYALRVRQRAFPNWESKYTEPRR